MTSDEIYAVLTEVFAEVFFRDVPLTPELTAHDVEGWDSHRMIEIVLSCEERLGVRMTSREIARLERVGDLVELIRQKAP